jgi:SAM-dependent methyltransferase
MDFLPRMPLRTQRSTAELRAHIESLDWFHQIDFGEIVTRGEPYDRHWSWVARHLQSIQSLIGGKTALELGPADGLWSCWLTKLGAAAIVAADIEDRQQYRLVIESFGLPVEYHPGLISTYTPRRIRRTFDLVVSLGVLYHVHDPLTTLLMYGRYLNPGGVLVLETGAVAEAHPSLFYTGNGLIYGHDGGNQFLPSHGFLSDVLQTTLGFNIVRFESRMESFNKDIRRDVGRSIIIATNDGAPNVHLYPMVLETLGMHTADDFGPIRWQYGDSPVTKPRPSEKRPASRNAMGIARGLVPGWMWRTRRR